MALLPRRLPDARGRRRALLALSLLAVVCGCGGGASPSGRAVFQSQCSGCHTLGAARSPPPVGGDLSRYRMTLAEAASFTKIMPTRRHLSRAEVAAVSAYVWSVQRRKAR